MKKQLLLLAALGLSIIGANAQGTWNPQATGFPNVSTGVFNISVADSNVVWISSYDGAVGGTGNYRDFSTTIDGGATWIPGVVSAPAGHAWSMIHGLDATTAWAIMYNATVGTGGGIWKTTDGGVNWAQQGVGTIFNTTSFPNVVYFWNANDGFSMGDPNPTNFELYTTTDGGTTWIAVPPANIPAPLAGEYGIVNHYEVVGNTIWFDTNKGRVYKSTDMGVTWTVSATGITVPTNGAMDIAFWDASNGLARLYNATTGVNTVRRTTDGGATWTAGTVTGNMFGSDLAYVPGTASRLVSTGAAAPFIGSSYSDDGGLTWTDIETGAQRTALGVWNTNTMWAGGFTMSPSSEGIFKFEQLAPVACGDPSISAGVMSAPDLTICFGDTLFISTTNAVSPSVGSIYGYAVILSTIDLLGSNDPLNQAPGVISGGTPAVFPVAPTVNTTLINNGATFAAGVYYFTPVVIGNATNPALATNITGYTLDPACTYTGASVMVTLYAAGDPLCTVGLNDINNGDLGVTAYQSANNVNMTINSAKQSNVTINIFDLTGRIVATENISVIQGANSHVIDAATLSTGTYVIRINDGSNVATSKLMIF